MPRRLPIELDFALRVAALGHEAKGLAGNPLVPADRRIRYQRVADALGHLCFAVMGASPTPDGLPPGWGDDN